MRRRIKKYFAIIVNPLIFLLLCVNVGICYLTVKHFAIPAMAYAYTVVIMTVRYDMMRHTSSKIDWYAKVDFNDRGWQSKMLRLFVLFVVLSVIFGLWIVMIN